LLLLLAWVLGFFAAIPIGATQIEIGKRAIADEISAALMVVAGSVISDVVYGAIALFGLAAFLRNRVIAGSFGLVGAGVLVVLAWFTFRNTADVEVEGKPLSPALRSRRMSFVTGFSLAATNPPIMFWWLLGAKLATDLGIVDRLTPADSAAFIAFGGLGLATYLALLVFVLRRVRHMIDGRTHRRIHRILAVLLVLLAAHLLFTAFRDFAPRRSGGEIPAKPAVFARPADRFTKP
jgi:threonine/homoserine/homoserine lactone efflux protein